MLGELLELATAFDRAGITPAREHPRVKAPGKTSGPCLRVRLDINGAVTRIERVTNEEWPGLWTIMEGNQNSFPIVRLKEPLLPHSAPDVCVEGLGQNQKQLDISARREQLLRALDTSQPCPGRSTQRLIDRLLSEKAPELLELCTDRPGLRPVWELAHRFALAVTDLASHEQQLLQALRSALRETSSHEFLDAIIAILFGTVSKKTKERKASFQLAYEADEFVGHTYTCAVRSQLITALLESDASGQGSPLCRTNVIECGISGEVGLRHTEPFPSVKLPVLGREFPLVSMFRESACNRRYGLTDSAIVPVTTNTALRLQDALREIVTEPRRDKNWCGIASGRFSTRSGRKSEIRDLLIVYPAAELNLSNAAPVGLFASGIGNQNSDFTGRARVICEALKGLARRKPGSRLHIMAIRRVSEGQIQLVVSESPTVDDVIRGVNLWQAGVQNLPPIGLHVPADGGGMVLERPTAPSPEQVIQLLQEQWMRDGATHKRAGSRGGHPFQPVPGPSIRDVLELMLAPDGHSERTAQVILETTLQRIGPLLVGLAGARIGSSKYLEEYPPEVRRIALRACSVLGICLYRCGSRTGEYMRQSAFDLGRLLALADILHKDYCIVVRDKMVPPSLIGNAVLGTAFQNPASALSELAERIRPYIGWAKTVTLPDNSEELIAVREARKTLQRFQPLVERLHESPLSDTCSDIQKAHILLGYLASPKLEDEDQEDDNVGK